VRGPAGRLAVGQGGVWPPHRAADSSNYSRECETVRLGLLDCKRRGCLALTAWRTLACPSSFWCTRTTRARWPRSRAFGRGHPPSTRSPSSCTSPCGGCRGFGWPRIRSPPGGGAQRLGARTASRATRRRCSRQAWDPVLYMAAMQWAAETTGEGVCTLIDPCNAVPTITQLAAAARADTSTVIDRAALTDPLPARPGGGGALARRGRGRRAYPTGGCPFCGTRGPRWS